MANFDDPQMILFSQHGMTDTNRTMKSLADKLALSSCHVVAPNLGYINTLFEIDPLIHTVEQAAKQTLRKYPHIPARIVATSLGGIIWIEVLSRHREWWDRIESLVLLGSPLGGADLARIIDPFGWGIGIAKHLGQNRRPLAESITAVIPTLVVVGNTTGGGDGTVPIESCKLKYAHFVCLNNVTHPQLRKHPAVVQVIQEFWSTPKTPLPQPENSLLLQVIEYFRCVPGMTDASERDFPKAKSIFSFSKGISIYTWTNLIGVKHVFIANSDGKCEYSGFVGWIHTAGLEKAINAILENAGITSIFLT